MDLCNTLQQLISKCLGESSSSHIVEYFPQAKEKDGCYYLTTAPYTLSFELVDGTFVLGLDSDTQFCSYRLFRGYYDIEKRSYSIYCENAIDIINEICDRMLSVYVDMEK
jgi:hypothetical protein